MLTWAIKGRSGGVRTCLQDWSKLIGWGLKKADSNCLLRMLALAFGSVNVWSLLNRGATPQFSVWLDLIKE